MTALTVDQLAEAERTANEDEPASLSFDGIPGAPRTWVVPGMYAIGEVTVDAGMGETAKGLRNVMFAVRSALGLPQPGESHEQRREPGRVLWVASGTEDDPIHDLAPRFTSAAAACADEFDLDPCEALAGLRYIHNLTEWPNGDPVEIPDHLPRIRAEVERLNALDAMNRPPKHPEYDGPGPRVRIVVFDPLDALLGPGSTIDSRPGARRVMGHLNRFAQGAQAAVPVVHHVIANGKKVAGSPAVTNSVRLAFITRHDPANELVKVMGRVKSNVSSPNDLRYVVAPSDPAPFVAFLGDQAAAPGTGGTLRDRIAATDTEQGTLRARVRAAAAQREPATDQADPGPDAGSWQVLRRAMTEAGEPGPAVPVGRTYPDVSAARAAARAHAGQALTWRTDDRGREVAGLPNVNGPGRHVVYVAFQAEPAASA